MGSLLVTVVVAIDILIPFMIADTVDENEIVTGKRQEGLFFQPSPLVRKHLLESEGSWQG